MIPLHCRNRSFALNLKCCFCTRRYCVPCEQLNTLSPSLRVTCSLTSAATVPSSSMASRIKDTNVKRVASLYTSDVINSLASLVPVLTKVAMAEFVLTLSTFIPTRVLHFAVSLPIFIDSCLIQRRHLNVCRSLWFSPVRFVSTRDEMQTV